LPFTQIAKRYNVAANTIRSIANGSKWSHVS
jgi:uncharacterized protein YjcR